ncbi:AfsR/SARP family transcriptional regulator [Kitasatospora sp. RG8]|uniref:AfsR/SARP family transcriptional regulator n=1 Tax=Kitasatospora sp. RG8 TaxID=2820815 RepID=UPI001AE03182|nr:AfsR/SARP family transcriptional regulator [Kitasatospora sp. RG8]MBP0454254.1 AfsR/SARP family transcriptional regulator [Kitasatospora sp. RG8]
MEIRVLGALEVRVCGVSVVPSAPKPRQVLALLALNADQVVPAAVLAEELWAGRPPRTARTTVQTYVLHLRDRIAAALGAAAVGGGAGGAERPAGRPAGGGPAGSDAAGTESAGSESAGGEPVGSEPAGIEPAKTVLETAAGGYRLNTGGCTVDVREFERLAGAGHRAMEEGDVPLAARQLASALALWRGAAVADVPAGPHLGVELRRLEETRLCALDQRIDADLRLGRHRVLLAELTVLVERYRTHESLHRQLMLALHRSGRRGEALEVYRRLRGTLVGELGIEPSAELRLLQREILLASPEEQPEAGQPATERPVAGLSLTGRPGAGQLPAGWPATEPSAPERPVAGAGRFLRTG